MIKNITLMCCFMLTLNLNAQEVTSEQWTHIQKRTADWCPNCGQWGWSFNESLHSEFSGDNVLIWNAHISSSDLSNPTSIALANNYGGNGQPKFFVDGADLSVSPNNASAKLEEVKQVVELNNSLPAFFGGASTASYNGASINVTSKAKLFVDTELTVVSMAVYLIKKETIASQSGQGSQAVHKNLVINHLTDDVFGPTIVNGDGKADDEHTVTSSIDITDIDPTEYQIATVLWAYIAESDRFQFLNANISEIANSVDTKNEIETNAEIIINSSDKSDVAVDIDSKYTYLNTQLSIFNTLGQKVSAQNMILVKGENLVKFNLENSASGMYILNIASEGKSISKQFFLK